MLGVQMPIRAMSHGLVSRGKIVSRIMSLGLGSHGKGKETLALVKRAIDQVDTHHLEVVLQICGATLELHGQSREPRVDADLKHLDIASLL
jgi:hypothetical protein